VLTLQTLEKLLVLSKKKKLKAVNLRLKNKDKINFIDLSGENC